MTREVTTSPEESVLSMETGLAVPPLGEARSGSYCARLLSAARSELSKWTALPLPEVGGAPVPCSCLVTSIVSLSRDPISLLRDRLSMEVFFHAGQLSKERLAVLLDHADTCGIIA